MMGKTQMQIRRENPEEELQMGITEHEEDGIELARVVAKMVEEGHHEKPHEPDFNPFSPKASQSGEQPSPLIKPVSKFPSMQEEGVLPAPQLENTPKPP